MSIRNTNEIIDQRLLNQGGTLKRISNYINNYSNIDFECLKCYYIWPGQPCAVAPLNTKPTGCPNCAGNVKLSNEYIDFFLKEKSIQRIGNYINIKTPIEFKCLILDCGLKWPVSPDSILHGDTGCPKCSKKLNLTNEEIDRRLLDRNIQRLDNYLTSRSHIRFKCLIEDCTFIWSCRPDQIFSGTGCPQCHKAGYNEKIIYKYLQNNNINFISQYRLNNSSNKINCYRIDFYLPDNNLFIEYNGQQHYCPTKFANMTEEQAQNKFIKQQKRDNLVRKFAQDNHIQLLEIDGRAYKDNKLLAFLRKIHINFKL